MAKPPKHDFSHLNTPAARDSMAGFRGDSGRGGPKKGSSSWDAAFERAGVKMKEQPSRGGPRSTRTK